MAEAIKEGEVNGTGALVLSKLSRDPQTTSEIAGQIYFSCQTVSRYLRQAHSKSRPRWEYGWRLRCRSCGR
jgi:hypothetical protein